MSTFPDMVKHMGGVPVASSNNYAGWWNQGVRFVDYENGTAGVAGNKMKVPQKNLETAILNSDAWDVIYVRPRTPDVAGGDPQAITPIGGTNWSIPNTKYGLSIIGTGLGTSAHQAAYQTRLQGGTSTDTPPLTVLAPYVNLENLSFKRGSSTGVPLVDLSSVADAYAFAASVNNCQFHMSNGTSGSAGALQISSHWYANVTNNHFERCVVGIGISSSLSNPKAVRISGNTFSQAIAANYGDIISAATLVERIFIDNNMFNHEIPTHASGKTDYIWFSGTCTGGCFNNYFGTQTLTLTTIITLSGIIAAGNMGEKGHLT